MATLKINTTRSDFLRKMGILSTRNIQYDVVFNSTTPILTRQLFADELSKYESIDDNYVIKTICDISGTLIETSFLGLIDLPGSSITFRLYPFQPSTKDKTKFGRLEIIKGKDNNKNVLDFVFSTVEIINKDIKKASVKCDYKYLNVGFTKNIVVVFDINFKDKSWVVSAPSEIIWLPQKKA